MSGAASAPGGSFAALTWDPAAVRRSGVWWCAAAAMLAYACVLVVATWSGGMRATGGVGAGFVVALLLGFDVAVTALPWRLPRGDRSPASVLLETGAVAVLPVGMLVVAARGLADAVRAVGVVWLLAGLAAGVVLSVAGGMRWRLLWRGDLAFLLGPRRRFHAIALAVTAIVGAVGEELAFRGTPLVLAQGDHREQILLMTVSAAAFVGRHHLTRHAQPPARREIGTQVLAAVVLSGLTVWTGSIFPALVAHLFNNIPIAILETQRAFPGGTDA